MSRQSVPQLLNRKRHGEELTPAEIRGLVEGYVAGEVAHEQMAAFCMAVCCWGASEAETVALTGAVIDSGHRHDLSALGRPAVDKHSTGGVGDKISLPLVPLVVACGAVVPQTAGRALGHTGGTLDKMESYLGWRARLTPDEQHRILTEVGGVISGQSDDLAPADRLMYALRDITGTVESVPLIVASVLGKKIAEGTQGLVLDVKVGSGAFMKDLDQATELARALVGTATRFGVATSALLTDMSTPLGLTVGNALEVREAVEVLQGGGPSDVVELTLALAREMVRHAGIDVDPATKLADGSAYDVWRRMVAAQGGDPDQTLPTATHVEHVVATTEGHLVLDAWEVAAVGRAAGTGRERKEDEVDLTAGVELLVSAGTRVSAGQQVARVHSSSPDRMAAAMSLTDAIAATTPEAPSPPPHDRVLARIG
ncbi:thymidine phosphorylase [Nocardioides hwasunensis]|uniref:thymidine phosphorylase n=1 Tax=Nocardioides hwasunensis TaxID=397258 RepID=UPI0029646AB4|nr:thymidine phosphorylase [Nocardioides hwasunensis]